MKSTASIVLREINCLHRVVFYVDLIVSESTPLSFCRLRHQLHSLLQLPDLMSAGCSIWIDANCKVFQNLYDLFMVWAMNFAITKYHIYIQLTVTERITLITDLSSQTSLMHG